MGNSCSCLNNITSLCSEDLSHGANDGTKNYINNDPKRNLSSYAISEKDPMISQRNTTNEINTISSRSNKNNTKKAITNLLLSKKIITPKIIKIVIAKIIIKIRETKIIINQIAKIIIVSILI